MPRIWRFRCFGLLVRLWRRNAFVRLILPLPVFLKRLAAPRWLLSFGMTPFQNFKLQTSNFERRTCSTRRTCRTRRTRLSLLPHPGPRRQDRVQLVAFFLRLGFDHANLAQVGDQPFENPPADL